MRADALLFLQLEHTDSKPMEARHLPDIRTVVPQRVMLAQLQRVEQAVLNTPVAVVYRRWKPDCVKTVPVHSRASAFRKDSGM